MEKFILADYWYLSTDIYPKITALKTDLQIALNKI